MFTKFLVEHDIAFNVADHASKLFQRMFPDSKIASRFRSCRTKTTALCCETLAPSVRKEVVLEMEKRPFSLMMDETTDIGTKKLLSWQSKIPLMN